MNNSIWLELGVGLLYPLFIIVIGIALRLYKTVTVTKVYLRQVCKKLDINSGKDLD